MRPDALPLLGDEREAAAALDESDTVAEIAAIENELDRLEDAAERCRKIVGAARLASAAGAMLLATAIWRADATSLVVGIAAILGGWAIAGSTRTTRAGILVRMSEADARRAALIDALDLTPAPAGTA